MHNQTKGIYVNKVDYNIHVFLIFNVSQTRFYKTYINDLIA